jgi:dienelactone hydrolase
MDIQDLARDWAALPQISSIHASGDGAWVFFCLAGLNEVDEVYVAPADGSAAPLQLTWGVDHHQIRGVAFDGSFVVLAQSLHACEHDHLMILDRRVGGKLRLLTPKQNDHYVYGGGLTRDQRAVIFVADFDYEAGAVIEGAMVWWQDIHTGERRCLARTRNFFDRAPSLSPSGEQILLNVNERLPGGTQLWVMNLDGSALREVLSLGMRNNTRGDWLDEDHVVFVTDKAGQDQVGVVNVLTGAVEWLGGEPFLMPHEVVSGAGRVAVICHDQSRSFARVWDGAWTALPNTTGRRFLLPHAAMPDGGWIAEAYDADSPHDLVRVMPDGSHVALSQFARSRRTYVRPRDFRWRTADGLECQGWLYQPEGPSKGFIAFVHGGPTWHSEDWVNPKIGFWVQAGFTVLDPNYRGSTGFGLAWREAVKADGWGGREQSDIRAGIEACVAQGIAARGKIAVAGNSYGGFSSWFAITRFADLVNAAIPMCGMYRLDIDYHATEMPHGRAYSIEMMGGTPEEVPAKYANASPGNFIANIKGAVMIVHGLADSNVGPENTHVAVRELAVAGIAHEVLLFEDEGHGVYRRSNVATYLAQSAAFLERAFGGLA